LGFIFLIACAAMAAIFFSEKEIDEMIKKLRKER